MRGIGTPAEGARLYGRLGLCYRLIRCWQKAKEHYEAMLQEARKAGDLEQQWEALQHLAMLGTDMTTDPEADDELFRGVKRKTEQEGADESEKIGPSAEPEVYEWSPSYALGRAEEALSLARETGDKGLIAHSTAGLALLGLYAGRWKRVAPGAAESRSLYAAMDNREMEAEILNLSAWGEVVIGHPEEAARFGRQRLAATHDLGDHEIHVADLHGLVLALLEVGDYGEALSIARRGAEAARSLGSSERLQVNLIVLGDVYKTLFRLEEAHMAYTEASDSVNISQLRAWTQSKLCAVAALEEDWEEARARALQAAALRGEVVLQFTAPFHFYYEIEALLRGGEEALAREELWRFAEAVGDNRRFRIAHLRARAVLERWEGGTGAAFESLREAEALAEEIVLPGELWQIKAALGEIHEELGEAEEARRVFGLAAAGLWDLAERIGEEGLREGFLGAPQVRDVLRHSETTGRQGR